MGDPYGTYGAVGCLALLGLLVLAFWGMWRQSRNHAPEKHAADLSFSNYRHSMGAPGAPAESRQESVDAAVILRAAAGHLSDRAATYDARGGERSMEKVAAMTRVLYADQLKRGELTEEMSWGIMVLLKLVRSSQGGYRPDNYEDGSAYFALMGECASKERQET